MPKKREKQNFKNMTLKKKLSHLWEYYKLHGFLIALVVLFIIYSVYTISKPRLNTSLSVAIVNNNLTETTLDKITREVEDFLQLDLDNEEVSLDSMFYFNTDGEYSMNARRALVTFVAASDIDIIIATESEFANYAHNNFLHNLTNQLPTDLYTSLANDFFITDTEDDKEQRTFGIYLNNAKYYNENYYLVMPDTVFGPADEEAIDEPYVLGIVSNSQNLNNSIDFIRYMFSQD